MQSRDVSGTIQFGNPGNRRYSHANSEYISVHQLRAGAPIGGGVGVQLNGVYLLAEDLWAVSPGLNIQPQLGSEPSF